ncbi:sensor histidine kinase [Streptomyces sp. NPDC004721]
MLRLMESLSHWRRRHPWLPDAVLVVLVGVPPVIREQAGWRPVWVQAVVHAALVLPLLWRRRYPHAVAVVVTAAFWAQYLGHVWGQEVGRGALAMAALLYTLVVRGLRRPAAAAAACAAGCVLLWVPDWLRSYEQGAQGGHGAWWTPASVTFWLAGSWVWGEYVRARRAHLAEFARRTELAESQRAVLARAAVADERARIAREIHDILAHGVSVMVVNAEGGRLAGHADPAAAHRALETISATGRDALVELRRLLDVLRPQGDGEDGHPRTGPDGPQPGLDELRSLVARFPGAATLELRGDRRGLPAGAALQTYRIVQEALTNVVKHAAPNAAVRVLVEVGSPGPERRIRIRVDNSPGVGAAPKVALPSAGRGVEGMRQRSALYGGTVCAGPTPEGGYRVDATLRPGPPASAGAVR